MSFSNDAEILPKYFEQFWVSFLHPTTASHGDEVTLWIEREVISFSTKLTKLTLNKTVNTLPLRRAIIKKKHQTNLTTHGKWLHLELVRKGPVLGGSPQRILLRNLTPV